MAATAEPEPPEPSTPPPPPAAPASSQERDLLADDGEEDAASASPGTTEVASGRVEGVEGGATGGGDDDDPPSSSSSTKRGKEGARSHDGRFPVRPAPFVNLRQRLRGLFSPRATDIQILVIKLEKQFEMLEVDFERYAFERYGSSELERINHVDASFVITFGFVPRFMRRCYIVSNVPLALSSVHKRTG